MFKVSRFTPGMKLTLRACFFFLICSFVLANCAIVIRPHQTGDLLLVDDFSSEKLPWDTWQRPDGSAASYYQSGMVLVVESTHTDVITTNGQTLDDVLIEVIGHKVAGSDDNHYGVICRYQDNENYYGFSVTSDGYYGIYKVKDGEYILLTSGNLEFSSVINQGNEWNILRATCNGDRLSFKVNQITLSEARDKSFIQGRTGLIAGTYSEPEIAVKFDNFVVTYP